MSWSAVGSPIGVSGTTFTLVPGAIGDLVILQVQNSNVGVWCTGASSSNATWTQQGGVQVGNGNARTGVLFFGKTTSTSSATVTLTFSGGTSTIRGVAMEFRSTVGTWAMDSYGLLDSNAGSADWAPCQSGSTMVQYAQADGASGTTISLTLNNSTTAGNCLIACLGSTDATTNATISSITLGSSADNWASAATAYNNADQNSAIWIDPNCAGGQTSVTVTLTGDSGGSPHVTLGVFEWAGIVTSSPLDQHTGGNGSGTAITTGATGTLGQAAEVAFATASGDGAITGPGLQWMASPPLNLISGSIESVATWQSVNATTALTYSATLSTSNPWGATIATLKLANAPVSGDLYFGYAVDGGTPIAGTTGGYTWNTNADGHTNGMAYNLNVSAGSTAPVWGDSGHEFGIMVLVKETSAATPAPVSGPRKAKGASATVKGAGHGSPRTKVTVFPGPPFQLPRKPAKGTAGSVKGLGRGGRGAPYVFIPPNVPSPFVLPRKPSAGASGALRGSGRGHLGSPYVFIPPPPVSPFTPPRKPAKGFSALARGSGKAHAGAPWQATTGAAWVMGGQVPITAGQPAGFSSWVMSPQGTTVQLVINWFGPGGSTGTSSSSAVTIPPMTPWFLQVAPSAAPAGTTYLVAEILLPGTPAIGTQLYWDKPRVSPAGYQATYLNDAPGDLQITEDIQYLYNDVAVTRNVDQVAIRVLNASSRKQYFPRIYTRTIYSSADDPNALINCANTLLAAFDQPSLRVEQVIVDAAGNPENWPFVLSADIGDLVSFTRTPVGGAPVTGSFLVLSVEVDIAPDKAQFTYVLIPAGVF